MASELVWNPVYTALEERIRGGDDLLLLITPFAKLEALQRLRSFKNRAKRWKVVCRWRIEDLIAGVSDLSVFEYLKSEGCDLYVNNSIHLKLYIFESNLAFTTSGNLTLRGLGYCEPANVESGAMLKLGSDDWIRIYEMINASRRVDEKLYEILCGYVESCPLPVPLSVPPDMFPPASKRFTIGSLPATESPQRLADYYFGGGLSSFSSEEVRRVAHDLSVFRIPDGLQQEAFHRTLRQAFITVPFVVEFVAFLKEHGSLRFGAVNDWIHDQCEDVPLPYRWEIKENTRILYNWLEHFFPEIEWNIPGAHSQVIYWRGSNKSLTGNDSAIALARYQKMFSTLGNRDRAVEWNDVSIGGAPHQPLLLLAVAKLYERDPNRPNLIPLNKDLENIFAGYFASVVAPSNPTSVAMPFVALRGEPFWHLLERETASTSHRTSATVQEKASNFSGRIRSQAAFDKSYKGAVLDDDLHLAHFFTGTRSSRTRSLIPTFRKRYNCCSLALYPLRSG